MNPSGVSIDINSIDNLVLSGGIKSQHFRPLGTYIDRCLRSMWVPHDCWSSSYLLCCLNKNKNLYLFRTIFTIFFYFAVCVPWRLVSYRAIGRPIEWFLTKGTQEKEKHRDTVHELFLNEYYLNTHQFHLWLCCLSIWAVWCSLEVEGVKLRIVFFIVLCSGGS